MGFFSEQPAVQDRLHRPLSMVGSGDPAASTFCESLADADAAALKRLRFALLDHFNMGYLNEIGPMVPHLIKYNEHDSILEFS